MFSSGHYERFGGQDRTRGRGRGRGRGRDRGDHNGTSRASRQNRGSAKIEIPRSLSPPVGPILTTINFNELEADETSSSPAGVTGLEDIASYNWLKADEPTIITPGKPPRWTPTVKPTTLTEDDPSGTYFRDPNAAYFPSYPMEPVVRAILKERPDFDSQEVDIFGCGSTLGNLLRFVRKVETEKPFRFLVEEVGETVFLIRRENSPKEVITDVYGYGHTFPEANTTWDTDFQSSDTHQRIIRYQLGHLNVLVRFEADGYLADEYPEKKFKVSPANQEANEDVLVAALTRHNINLAAPKNSDSLKVLRGQGSVPQSTVFDLKTRSIKKKLLDTTVADQLPRLWIRQIPFLILAYHDRGLFSSDEVTVHNIKTDLAKWENENRRDVRKLIGLIEKIASLVKATPGRKLEVRYRNGFGLELREQAEGVIPVLPNELATQWTEGRDRAESYGAALLDGTDDGAGPRHDPIQKQMPLEEDNAEALNDDEYDWDKKEDFTACSMETCNYCGNCSY